MRTVHTFTISSNQQQQQQQQQQPTNSSASTNSHSHSNMTGYSSARHSWLRMHSQLRSAPQGNETTPDPIDLSQTRPASAFKIHTRSSTASTNMTSLRTVPIITSSAAAPTHTIYSNILPSSNAEKRKNCSTISANDTVKYSSSPTASSTFSPMTHSPKLAYAFSNIEENLQCPLCIDRLRDPRALPCQHVFCCACLKSIPSSNLPNPTIACPLCRRSFPYHGADQFPISYIHRQLLDLVPNNYDVNGKCSKCQEKTSLLVCSCCDYLLCRKCYQNDREKILDDIQHYMQTCVQRLNRIHQKHDLLRNLKEQNRKKIQQIENLFENFERKLFQHKQTTLNSLNQFNEEILEGFWTKLELSKCQTTEQFSNVVQQAQLLLKKSETSSFEEILSLCYNLNSADEQLEKATRFLETFDLENLSKQQIDIDKQEFEDQVQIRMSRGNGGDKVFSLLPPSVSSRPRKRLRKTEPKRFIEVDDVDDDPLIFQSINSDEETSEPSGTKIQTECSKRMKIEYQTDDLDLGADSMINLNSILFTSHTDHEQQTGHVHDNDVIYLQTVQGKSPESLSIEELFQIISTNQ